MKGSNNNVLDNLTGDEVLEIISKNWIKNNVVLLTRKDIDHVLSIINFPQYKMISSDEDKKYITEKLEKAKKIINDIKSAQGD